MAQINTNIAYSINRFKILSDEIESHLMVKNLDDWEKGDYGFFLNANGEFENDDIGNKEEAYVYKSFVAVTNISFDYKVSSEGNYDYFRVYINDDEVVKTSGSHDYKNYIKSFDAPTDVTLKISYKKDVSVSRGGDAGYFKNLKFILYAKKNGNYIRTKISRFPTILNQSNFKISRFLTILNQSNFKISRFLTTLNQSNFKISRFLTTLNHNTFIIKSFTNQSKNHFYRLGRDLTVPPKRIIFKNFED